MQTMSSQSCRMKAEEERANAAATSLPQVRERAARAAAAWTAMAVQAGQLEAQRETRNAAAREIGPEVAEHPPTGTPS